MWLKSTPETIILQFPLSFSYLKSKLLIPEQSLTQFCNVALHLNLPVNNIHFFVGRNNALQSKNDGTL